MEYGNRKCRRIALEVQYDGTGFNGWQIQNNGRTVQGEIEYALKILLKENIRVTASGRTDTGVHASGQVVHFDTDSDIHLQRVCIGLNGILPYDVCVKNSFNVDDAFHARFSAVERNYIYLIYNHPLRSPFMKYRAMWVHDALDINYLRDVCSYITGEKDFASFCKKRESEKINTVRNIKEISIAENDEIIKIKITGNAFLHNMIRIMIGTILDLHRSSAAPEKIKEIIGKHDRIYSGPTAPAYGLYLDKVLYEPDLIEMDSAF